MIDAPLVIEDRSARVLAFSGRQEEADSVRMRTVLGRQDPDEYVELHREQGVFEQLYEADEPLLFGPMGDEQMPLVAVAVRTGKEILGSMWAAVPAPLSEERARLP